VQVAASGSSKAQDSQTCVAGSAQVVASQDALSTHMPSTLRYKRLLAEVKPHAVAWPGPLQLVAPGSQARHCFFSARFKGRSGNRTRSTFSQQSAHLRQRRMQLDTIRKRRSRRCRGRAACPPRRLRTRWRDRRRCRYRLPRRGRSSSKRRSLQRGESVSQGSSGAEEEDVQSSAKNGPEAVHSSAEM
jgi:hypothetical protein